MFVYVYPCMRVYACIHACRDRFGIRCLSLSKLTIYFLFIYFLRQVLLTKLKFADSSRLLSQWAPEFHIPPLPQFSGCGFLSLDPAFLPPSLPFSFFVLSFIFSFPLFFLSFFLSFIYFFIIQSFGFSRQCFSM